MTQPCPICGGIGEHYGVCREVGKRMMALTRRVGASDLAGTLHEAQEIVKLLPVDPDVATAAELLAAASASARPEEIILNAIKCGRALERTTPTGDQS